MATVQRKKVDVTKMTRAERAKYEASLAYKRAYHAKKRAEREAQLNGQKVRNARQNGRQEGIAIAIGRVETLLAQRNELKLRDAEIVAELQQLLK